MTIATAAPPSSRRIEANRPIARKSNGPGTPEGIEPGRLDAPTHGLTAASAVLPHEDPEALESRVRAWKEDLGPRDSVETYLVERAAHASWQLDRVNRTIAARLSDRLRHHAIDREVHEADVVADLARRLLWDPRGPISLYPHLPRDGAPPGISTPHSVEDPLNPARIVNLLESTALGCRWLLDRWRELRGSLEDGLKWTPPDRLRAIRLLGRQPLDALEDGRVSAIYLACGAMDPQGPPDFDDLRSELEQDDRDRFVQRVEDRGGKALKPPTPDAGKAVLLELVDHVVTRLESLRRVHQERHAPNRQCVLDALAFEHTDEGKRLRRYQLAHGRMLFRSLSTFFRVREEADARQGAPADAELVTHSSPIVPMEYRGDETIPNTTAKSLDALLQAESGDAGVNESNPGPSNPRRTEPLDPCSEGRHAEPPIDEDLLPILRHPSDHRDGKAIRPSPSGPIPPMMVGLLADLLVRRTGPDGPPTPIAAPARSPHADSP